MKILRRKLRPMRTYTPTYVTKDKKWDIYRKSNRGFSFFTKFIFVAITVLPVKIYAASSVLLDTATAITDGLRLCDAAGDYCVDITRNSGSTSTTEFDISPSIGNVGGGTENRIGSDQIVILDYDTSNSPTPFLLEDLSIANINSLSAADSTIGVRDAYSWSQPGTWTIQGTGDTNNSPAGAVVSIDRAQGNDVGTFVTLDPDGDNDLSIISQFTILPLDANDVLLNMTGEDDGHDVVYTLDTPTETTSMYVFNSGGRFMGWSFIPSMTVTVPDPVSDPILPALTPASCGAVMAEGWIIDPGQGLTETLLAFSSGDISTDPELFFAPYFQRNSTGEVEYFNNLGIPSVIVDDVSTFQTTDLINTGTAAEIWRVTARVDGVPGQAYSYNLPTGSAFEFLTYWITDSNGAIVDSLNGPNNGWWGGYNSTRPNGNGPNVPVNYTVPASSTDGILFLNIAYFDPQVNGGALEFSGYNCPASLTLLKDVTNDDGGTAVDTDWTLEAIATDGTTTVSGKEGDTAITFTTTPTINTGTYTLSESGPEAYSQTSLICTGGADSDTTDGITLVSGEEVTCTFTNDDILTPVANNDTETNNVIGSETTVNILVGDTDGDGTIVPNTVSFTSNDATDTDGDGDNDQLIVAGEGTWAVDPDGIVTFTPLPDFTANPTPITYTVSDDLGLASNEATISIDYPDAPIVDNDGLANPTLGSDTVVNVLANDGGLDPNAIALDATTVQILGADPATGDLVVAGEGTWSVNPTTGAITFDPLDSFIGDPTVIRYTVEDIHGNISEPATVTVTYGEPPIAVDDNAVNPVVGNDTVVDVLASDSDLDGSLVPATVQILGTTNPGDPLVVNGEGEWTVDLVTGSITFDPLDTFTSDPTPIQYTVDDDAGNTSNPAAVNIDYGDLPVATPDGAANPTIGTPTAINVVGNDTDPDGNIDPATVMIIDPDTNLPITTLAVVDQGTWTVDPSGTITFTPLDTFNGDPTVISYTVNDNNGNTSEPATVTVTYGLAPEATDDMLFNPILGSDTVINVVGNDNDTDSNIDPATVMIIDPNTNLPVTTLAVPGEGTWTVDPVSGAITFSPLLGFTGDPTPITYTVKDEDDNTSNIATVTVTYGEAPVAADDTKENLVIGSPTTIDLVSNDGDPDGSIDLDSVQLVGTTNPGDPLIVPNEGTWTVNPGTGTITFTPLDTFTGDPAPIQYIVDDNSGNPSEPAIVTVDYPDAPVVDNDGAANPTVGTDTEVDVLANDGDPNGIALDPATVQIVGTSAPGEPLVVAGQGTWTVNPTTGAITFEPEDGFIGDPMVISYTVDDIHGNASDPATVTVTYGAPPLAVDDNASNPLVGTPTVVSVLGNDSDLEDDATSTVFDPATVVIIDPANPDTPVTSLEVVGQGTWTVNTTTGDITFTPLDTFTGDPTPIQYTVDDSDGNTSNPASVNVDYGDVPVASPDGAANPLLGSPTTIEVFANDNDPDGNIVPTAVAIVGADPDGSLTVPNEGTWTVEPSGAITFTPLDGFIADPAVISYTVEDNDGNVSAPATVTVTYGDAPEATDDTQFNPTLGSDTVVDVLGNDNDPDGTLNPATVQIVGTASPGAPLVVLGQGEWTIDTATGKITFNPEDGFLGDPAPITYTVSDDVGNLSNPAIVTVTYGEAPIAAADSQLNPVIGTPTVVSLIGNDGDTDGTLDLDTVQLVGTNNPGEPLIVASEGEWTVNPGTGTITFTPLPGFAGDPTPVAYTISDDSGNVSNEAEVTVTYGKPPVAVNNSAENPTIGAPTTVTLLGNTDSDGTVESVQLVGANASGDLVVAGQGTWSVNTDGTVTFTPLLGYIAEPTPAPYTVTDSDGNVSNEALITVTYGQPPVAGNDVATTTITASSGGIVTIDVISGSDSDPDNAIDPSSVDLDPSTPGIDNIFINSDGTYAVDSAGIVTFTPADDLRGNPEPIEYTVRDIFGNVSNPALISISFAAESIPTLSEWMLILLTMMLLLVGYRENARKSKKEGIEF